MCNPYHHESTIAAHGSASYDATLTLQQQVRELESELTNVREDAKSKEEILRYLLKEEVLKGIQLTADLEIAKTKRAAAKSELNQKRSERNDSNTSFQQVRKSAGNLSKVAATDREWIQAEMSRRSAITEASTHRSDTKLTQMNQEFSQRGRVSVSDLSKISAADRERLQAEMSRRSQIINATNQTSGTKLTSMAQGLFQRGQASTSCLNDAASHNSGLKLMLMTQRLLQRGRASATGLSTVSATDPERLQAEMSRRSQISNRLNPNSGNKLTSMTQELFQRGRASTSCLNEAASHNSGLKLTPMTQGLFQRGRALATGLSTVSATDRERLQAELSRRSTSGEGTSENSGTKLTPMTQGLFQRGQVSVTDMNNISVTDQEWLEKGRSTNAEAARLKRVSDRAWLNEEMSGDLGIAKTIQQKSATKLAQMKRSITSNW